jgi:hypothetical protein
MKKALPVAFSLLLGAAAYFAALPADGASVRVRGAITKRGKYVAPHSRSTPNKSKLDNYSTKGNANPFTGKPGSKPLTK